jgi:hypothetical protein
MPKKNKRKIKLSMTVSTFALPFQIVKAGRLLRQKMVAFGSSHGHTASPHT